MAWVIVYKILYLRCRVNYPSRYMAKIIFRGVPENTYVFLGFLFTNMYFIYSSISEEKKPVNDLKINPWNWGSKNKEITQYLRMKLLTLNKVIICKTNWKQLKEFNFDNMLQYKWSIYPFIYLIFGPC